MDDVYDKTGRSIYGCPCEQVRTEWSNNKGCIAAERSGASNYTIG